ncbi:sugar transporter [Pacificimonas flava]|uniref:Sugar transporter n=2 Tax=Pacificimonas TaxID=1960290 RepID=A0A219B3A5_9SPHN|nr:MULTISPECIES: MFS transporter [Pacificimonas]MBZ6377447.1 MFS transporter [Pacificimonas aurantium]OWV32852.1 sugar transporter [Pacificimonas flava]
MKEPAGLNQAALERELIADEPTGASTKDKPSLWTKFAYGFGSVAYGIKDQGFKYFLLLFYAQVVGLDSRLVSLAIMVALIADAFSDPLVGYWSDNLRSRWGRRHPFMYGAAIPIVVTYYFLWTPPDGLSQAQLFWYVVILSILIRTIITLYETPGAALAAELTQDYDQRSSLLSWRYFFGWSGGNIMTVVSFGLIFAAFSTEAIPNGQFNPEAYRVYALAACSIILISILVSSLGTHARIKDLPKAPPQRTLTLGIMFREILETFRSRSFAALFIASLLGYIASGLGAGLAFYFSTFFWGFTPMEIFYITAGVFLSAIIGAPIAAFVSRTIGKKRGAVIIGLVAFLGSPTPVFLRLVGVMPENGDPLLFPIIFVTTTLDVALIICYQILAASMLADLVEDAELRTHRRSEGLFFAAATFMRKWGEGLGIVVAGFVISLAGIATGAQQGEVSDLTLFRLAVIYMPVYLGFYMAMIFCISRYQLSREGHEENLRQLDERRQAPA